MTDRAPQTVAPSPPEELPIGLRNGDVTTGMIRARQLGMLTYRGRDELAPPRPYPLLEKAPEQAATVPGQVPRPDPTASGSGRQASSFAPALTNLSALGQPSVLLHIAVSPGAALSMKSPR